MKDKEKESERSEDSWQPTQAHSTCNILLEAIESKRSRPKGDEGDPLRAQGRPLIPQQIMMNQLDLVRACAC